MNMLAAIFCVALFSLTVPFTRMAAIETAPETIIFVRLIGASLVCLVLALKDGWVPPRSAWLGLSSTAIGSVIGFSSFTAFAMKQVPSGHAAVALASMPMVTAAYSTLRDRINPGLKFWLFAVIGTLLSFGFFFVKSVDQVLLGDFLLIIAVFCAAFGYVEGGRLSRLHGGKRVMSWAVILTLPISLPLAVWYFSRFPAALSHMSASTFVSVSYLALVSQSSGMFLWFKVLATGPMEKVALVQLLQPFLTLLASILLLQESVMGATWMIAALVALCIVGANHEKNALHSTKFIEP